MTEPFFSVIIPTYNRADFVTTAIKSVCEQTYSDWELLVIDDGSTDDTRQIVEGFDDDRIKYVWQENQERSAARNHGIRLSQGQYICFLDSDDYLLPEHLANIYAIIEKQKFPEAVFMTGMQCCDIEDNDLNGIDPFPEKDNLHIYILKNLLSVSSSSLAVQRNIFKKHTFDPRFSLWEDTHLWIRVLSEYPLFSVSGNTAIAVAHPESGIKAGIEHINLDDVKNYINAVDDLFKNYKHIFNQKGELQKNYLDAKYRMYLYHARRNRQVTVSIQILLMAIQNKFAPYYLSELLKIPLNALGIGLNNIQLGRTIGTEENNRV